MTANFVYNGVKNCLGNDLYTCRKRFHGHNSLREVLIGVVILSNKNISINFINDFAIIAEL